MSNLDDAIAKAKAGQPSYYSFEGVNGLMPLHKLSPQELNNLELIQQRGYGSAGLPLQKPIPHIPNPITGLMNVLNHGIDGKHEGMKSIDEGAKDINQTVDKYHNKINYATPSVLDGLNITPELQENQVNPEEVLLQILNQRGLA